jgi:hypothetical protein
MVGRLQRALSVLAKAASSGVSVDQPVKPVGEPNAANPHVRFDEREVETGQGVPY